jgi:hypothetical protein
MTAVEPLSGAPPTLVVVLAAAQGRNAAAAASYAERYLASRRFSHTVPAPPACAARAGAAHTCAEPRDTGLDTPTEKRVFENAGGVVELHDTATSTRGAR